LGSIQLSSTLQTAAGKVGEARGEALGWWRRQVQGILDVFVASSPELGHGVDRAHDLLLVDATREHVPA
jgi:hypothetical protein